MLPLKKVASIVLHFPQMLLRTSFLLLSVWNGEDKQCSGSILQVVIRDTYHFKLNLQHLLQALITNDEADIFYTP